jgi:hypothetical protein
MKKKNLFRLTPLACATALMLGLAACEKENTTPAPAPPPTGTTGGTTPPVTPPAGGQVVDVSAPITTNTTWTAGNKYLLKGYIYVRSGATLTIEPGTIIKGDKDTKGSLIIEPGAKIEAKGTAEKPIVFTSNQPKGSRNYGDWGGVIIAGKAPVNPTEQPTVEGGLTTKYGGTDPADNSGTFQYVRIEFSGIAFLPNSEINGLTLAGVGSGTTIDHVQVSYNGDDSFEWFGGTVNAKYLISHRAFDDDFDTDFGYSGKVQFGVSLRDPLQADQSGSKAFESDNDGNSSNNSPRTSSVFSNITAIGPLLNPNGIGNISNQYTAGAHLRRNTTTSILNSVIVGYPTGLLVDNGVTAARIAAGELVYKNNIIAGSLTNSNSVRGQRDIIYVGPAGGPSNLTPNSVMSSDSAAWGSAVGPLTWLKASNNRRYTNADNVQLLNPFNLTAPSFIPRTASPIVIVSPATAPAAPADFTHPKVADAFFTKVNYIGAFSGSGASADNWMAGWTNFDPQNTDY